MTEDTTMQRQELEARANAKAHAEHVHIFAVPGRPGVYVTSSKSEPGKKYSLVAKDGIEACSCRGFEYRGSCKHVEALRNRLAREAVQAARQQRAAQPVRVLRASSDDLYGPEAA
jgi:hypothetical protein